MNKWKKAFLSLLKNLLAIFHLMGYRNSSALAIR